MKNNIVPCVGPTLVLILVHYPDQVHQLVNPTTIFQFFLFSTQKTHNVIGNRWLLVSLPTTTSNSPLQMPLRKHPFIPLSLLQPSIKPFSV